ncbi:helix-turn-helix domain-containing protein [Trueperella pyogenes]|uniref:helix-turn-helix domain-containing protein n=1 Tax=Trueperella pyogenes TaxID=1661 RepID=UPI001CB8AA98
MRVCARDGAPHAEIARDLGISRNTVARVVKSDRPPVYDVRPGSRSLRRLRGGYVLCWRSVLICPRR